MELTFTTNTAYSAKRYREATLNGKRYLVVPMALINPGVLDGSKGPLYYPPEEISRNIEQWNGMPLTVNHPVINGRNVSARSPQVLQRFAIGIVLNARLNPKGKLIADGWFDIEAVTAKEPRILEKLKNGQPIELSTGLYTDNYLAVNGAAYNGRPYTFVAKNYRADHVAILVDQVGACSLRDGCGVLIENAKKPAADGRWVTTEDGQHLFLTGSGKLHPNPYKAKGNKQKAEKTKVVEALNKKQAGPLKINNVELTQHERGAIDSYSGSHYQLINEHLRKGGTTASTSEIKHFEAEAQIKKLGQGKKNALDIAVSQGKAGAFFSHHIDSALSKSKLENSTTLHKGLAFASSDNPLAKLKVGDTHRDLAYTSSSSSPESAKKFTEEGVVGKNKPHKYLLQMSVKAGTPAIDMSATGAFMQSMVGHEKEVLLPRGMSHKVTKIEKKDGMTVIHVDSSHSITTNIWSEAARVAAVLARRAGRRGVSKLKNKVYSKVGAAKSEVNRVRERIASKLHSAADKVGGHKRPPSLSGKTPPLLPGKRKASPPPLPKKGGAKPPPLPSKRELPNPEEFKKANRRQDLKEVGYGVAAAEKQGKRSAMPEVQRVKKAMSKKRKPKLAK